MTTMSEKRDPEVLSGWQCWVEVAIVVALLGLFGFLAYHQAANTGFFTEKFGSLEMLCLYGPLLLATIAPIIRAVNGRRYPARPYEAIASLSLALGSLWLLSVFPFNFAHLADALPTGLHFLLAWVTDGMGRTLLILQIIIAPISALLATWRYLTIRERETIMRPRRRML